MNPCQLAKITSKQVGNGDLLLKFAWKNNYVEVGSGDGMFSYIMHGNSFPIWFDRYLNTDLDKKNICCDDFLANVLVVVFLVCKEKLC